ncbi:hypothetical protein V2J74_10085 [Pseudomonas alliivorans]|nr:hypothetical protein [Pseudomonas alliivorans]
MTNKPNSGTVSVSRELLVDLLDAAKWKAADFAKGTPYRTTIDGIVRQTKDLLAQPADQQGEPAAWQAMAVGKDGEIYRNVARAGQQKLTLRDARFAWGEGVLERFDVVIRPLFAQPATAKVVLPERLDIPHRGEFESANQHAAAVGEAKSYNACLDEVAKLNGINT